MNRDILAARWTQLRGQLRENWGKLTNDDLDRVQGRWEQLIGLLQERYAFTKAKAEAELDAFLEKVAPREGA
jgi:uncharacterized protein YjbJ (UPF0337 family)